MPREFTSADIVQSLPGISAAVVDPGIALPNPAVEGNGGLIIMGALTIISPPEQWASVAQAGTAGQANPQISIMCRPGLPPGDQSWAFTAVGGVPTEWAWLTEEWTNLSFAPLLASANASAAVSAPTSISAGTTGSWEWPYAVGIAAVYMINGGASVNPWPTTSWSGGFTETDVITDGVGSGANDQRLWVARRYGVLDETGPWSTTVTFTGTVTATKSAYAAMAVFRAEAYPGEA